MECVGLGRDVGWLRGLGPQGLLHLVEPADIGQLEGEGLGTREAHHQQRHAVPGEVEIAGLAVGPGIVGRNLLKHKVPQI